MLDKTVSRTPLGEFVEDDSGLCHYIGGRTGWTVGQVAEDALSNPPRFRPSWFWFNGIFTPMHGDDTPETLAQRWLEWANRPQGITLLSQLENYSGIRD